MKNTAIVIGIVFLMTTTIEGSVFKGQRTYMRSCKACHQSGGDLAKSHTQDEWEEFFEDHAKKLISLHKNNANAMKILASKKFQKNIRHLRQFFMKYASDSGNVPACN